LASFQDNRMWFIRRSELDVQSLTIINDLLRSHWSIHLWL